MRNYVMIAEFNESDYKATARREMIEKLAKEWNDINNRIERRSWRSQEDLDEESYFHQERLDDEIDEAKHLALEKNPNLTQEELNEIESQTRNSYYEKINEEESRIFLKQAAVEELLEELGARMMQPYEHWNEEAAYMEYMENRYSYNDY